jgi:hypothetical protein
MTPDLDSAEHFLAAHGRVLDRRRFERLFRDGDAGPVRDAVAAHRNPDGGFGHSLEPDCRAPGSQPGVVEVGLRTLHEAGAWDEALVRGACDYLEATAPAPGGAVFVAPGIEPWPHAPWWAPERELRPSLVPTGQIAGTLHARAVEHPWLERATAWLWDRIGTLEPDTGPYALYGAVRFLDFVPDRERATAALERAAAPIRALTAASGDGESHGLLRFAPYPDSIARGLFDDAEVSAALDELATGQREDGGWTFDWPAWSPVAEAEWRGTVTVDALALLRANGR